MQKSRRSSVGSGRRSKSSPTTGPAIAAIVTGVILDEESQAITDELTSPSSIGAIQFKILGKVNSIVFKKVQISSFPTSRVKDE